MWACLSGHLVVAQRLLARGADPNVKDGKGSLPLHAAADGGYLELVRFLLPRTGDPHARNDDGQRPADYARRRGFDQVEKLLARSVAARRQ
jgi:ankyrin repeat protein